MPTNKIVEIAQRLGEENPVVATTKKIADLGAWMQDTGRDVMAWGRRRLQGAPPRTRDVALPRERQTSRQRTLARSVKTVSLTRRRR